jgi:hypothetical protein
MTKDEQDEIQKWIASRRRNFPSKAKLEEKTEAEACKADAGALKTRERVEPKDLSRLEMKLRKKLRFITSQMDPGSQKRQLIKIKEQKEINEGTHTKARVHKAKSTQEEGPTKEGDEKDPA